MNLESPQILTPEEKRGQRLLIYVFFAAFLGLMVDGMDLLFLALSLTSLKAEFGLSDVQAGSLGSFSMAGMAIGGIISGYCADRFGRVRTLVWAILVFSVGTACLGLTHSYFQFALVRMLSALGLGAEYMVANLLMAEYVPAKRRTTVLSAVQTGWSVGYMAASVLARWIIPNYGWRFLFAASLLPVLLALWIRRQVPEPPVWVAVRKRVDEEKAEGIRARTPVDSVWKTLWNNPMTRFTFIAWAATTAFIQFGYHGMSNWLPAYLEGELGLNFMSMTGFMIGTYSAMIIGKILAGVLADKFGRRVIFVFGAIGAAICLPLIVYCSTPDNIVYLLTFFGFLYGVPWGVNATYMAESFATRVRGTAMGAAWNFGRIGGAAAPLAIGFTATYHSIGLGFVIMGGAYFIAGIIPSLFIKDKIYDTNSLLSG